MSENITIRILNNNNAINCVVARDEIWYRAKDVALALGYNNTKKAVIDHVLIENKIRLDELKPQANLDYNGANSIYINEVGLRSFVIESQLLTASDLATQLGISVQTRYVRQETEIVGFVQDVLTQKMVPVEFQKNVNNFRIDLHLPDQKLAIEIGERNHADRDLSYEEEREMY
ncbi:MAG: Bro-N domain-containing protein, partial [Candidatus Fonsibacter sp.]